MTTQTQSKRLLTVYNNFSNDIFGGLENITCYNVGNCLEAAKKSKMETWATWTARYNEYKYNNDEEGMNFAQKYINQSMKELDSLRVIDSNEYYSEQRRLILTGEKEISEDLYFDMLGCLPPLKMGEKYFIMSEFYTGTYTRQFFKRDGKFYMQMIDYADKETWAVV